MTKRVGDKSRGSEGTFPELSALAAEMRAVGKAQGALADSLTFAFTYGAQSETTRSTTMTKLQAFDRLAQEIEELARVLDRIAQGQHASAAVRGRMSELSERLTARLEGRSPSGATEHARVNNTSMIDLF